MIKNFFSFLLLLVTVQSQSQQAAKANYRLAARFAPSKVANLLFSTTVQPNWVLDSNCFWYTYQTTQGRNWYWVDASAKKKELLFHPEKLAASITELTGHPFDKTHLPIDSIQFKDNYNLYFSVKVDSKREDSPVFYFLYDRVTQRLLLISSNTIRKLPWASFSPDGSRLVFIRNHNLFWMDKENYMKACRNEGDTTIVEHQLTKDGTEEYSYATIIPWLGTGEDNVSKEKNKNQRKPATVFWSPDSKKLALIRIDNRRVNDLWIINHLASPRPTLETYKYFMPGEDKAPHEELVVVNLELQQQRTLTTSRFKDQSITLWTQPNSNGYEDNLFSSSSWIGNTSTLFFSRTSRDLKKIDLCLIDIQKDSVLYVIEERMNTYLDIKRPYLLPQTKELIHWSERDGWGHFYLYDSSGKLKQQLTKGSYHTEEVVTVDEKKRIFYFTANGKEKEEDPYYQHLYAVSLGGGSSRLLNAGNYDHQIRMNVKGGFFIDNFSRVNTAPSAVLKDNKGNTIMHLETADMSELLAAGYQFPEPFTVKADDGVTDLYGVMYKPYDFNPQKKYPVIAYVYPGPHIEVVNKSFSRPFDRTDRLAQLGFIVITVGNRGGHANRSKWYHNYGYGNLRDFSITDKKTAIEQLANRHNYIDMDRVGINGHSGGGSMSATALLLYPDFFKVGVSCSGNHDNRIYSRWWSEKHHGINEIVDEKGDTSFVYSIDRNPDLAKNLKGRLLLFHGEIDNNVHPATTIRMINALIKANKRFDMLLLPGTRHQYGDMTEYFFWKMADYFSEHLLGDKERSVDILEMNREVELSGNKRKAL